MAELAKKDLTRLDPLPDVIEKDIDWAFGLSEEELYGEPDKEDDDEEDEEDEEKPTVRHGSHNQKTHGQRGAPGAGQLAGPPEQRTAQGGALEFAKLSASLGSPQGELLAKHGKGYAFDADSIKGPRGPKQQCYMNAGKNSMTNGVPYAEGYLVIHGVPISHAWNISPSGKVIDPTLRDLKGVQGYFGVTLQPRYLMQTVTRTRLWGVLGDRTGTDNARRILNGVDKEAIG
jgi:hypothetical protein